MINWYDKRFLHHTVRNCNEKMLEMKANHDKSTQKIATFQNIEKNFEVI